MKPFSRNSHEFGCEFRILTNSATGRARSVHDAAQRRKVGGHDRCGSLGLQAGFGDRIAVEAVRKHFADRHASRQRQQQRGENVKLLLHGLFVLRSCRTWEGSGAGKSQINHNEFLF
jgi:hypothetical protein